jgi:heat shock transcription factor
LKSTANSANSFLDDNKNTTLIRWSDDGNSFIVIDEDEFARTLIPELFKHNNYASFVRQLNMYGFHKKVGLSDNSMKASETKAKAPSEYYNKYFKRGRPELLWLIQKPKNPPPGPKRKRDDDGKRGDSDEDRTYQDGGGGGYEESMAVRANQEMTMIPRNEYNSLRSEVRTLQQQQKVISNVLGQIRRQNDQLYQQATAFQTLHDRHENSINAILTFLATFYNRTLEGNNGANLADMFGTATAQQQQSNVVDVSDLPDGSMGKSPQMHRQGRRPLALLPAPTSKDGLHAERTATLSPSARSPAAPSPIVPPASRPNTFRSSSSQNRASPAPAGVGTRSASAAPPAKGESPGMSSLPENDEIMSAIQNVNASQPTSQTPQFDFPAALANYQIQGGNVPLTPQQRNEVLSLMANNTSAASPNSTLAHNANNAMVSPQAPPMPDIRQFQATQAQLDLLQKMSEEQNTRVQSLHERLQPLSPSGQIPGMNNYFGTASLGEPGTYDLDLDNFTHGDDYFPQNAATGQDDSDIALPDLNFDLTNATTNLNGANFDGAADADMLGFDGADAQGGRVESVSSSATSPAATVEDVDEEEDRLTKRRKKGAYRA